MAILNIAEAKQSPPIPESLSPCAKDFLSLCLALNPKKRPQASQLLQHHMFVNPQVDSPGKQLPPPGSYSDAQDDGALPRVMPATAPSMMQPQPMQAQVPMAMQQGQEASPHRREEQQQQQQRHSAPHQLRPDMVPVSPRAASRSPHGSPPHFPGMQDLSMPAVSSSSMPPGRSLSRHVSPMRHQPWGDAAVYSGNRSPTPPAPPNINSGGAPPPGIMPGYDYPSRMPPYPPHMHDSSDWSRGNYGRHGGYPPMGYGPSPMDGSGASDYPPAGEGGPWGGTPSSGADWRESMGGYHHSGAAGGGGYGHPGVRSGWGPPPGVDSGGLPYPSRPYPTRHDMEGGDTYGRYPQPPPPAAYGMPPPDGRDAQSGVAHLRQRMSGPVRTLSSPARDLSTAVIASGSASGTASGRRSSPSPGRSRLEEPEPLFGGRSVESALPAEGQSISPNSKTEGYGSGTTPASGRSVSSSSLAARLADRLPEPIVARRSPMPLRSPNRSPLPSPGRSPTHSYSRSHADPYGGPPYEDMRGGVPLSPRAPVSPRGMGPGAPPSPRLQQHGHPHAYPGYPQAPGTDSHSHGSHMHRTSWGEEMFPHPSFYGPPTSSMGRQEAPPRPYDSMPPPPHDPASSYHPPPHYHGHPYHGHPAQYGRSWHVPVGARYGPHSMYPPPPDSRMMYDSGNQHYDERGPYGAPHSGRAAYATEPLQPYGGAGEEGAPLALDSAGRAASSGGWEQHSRGRSVHPGGYGVRGQSPSAYDRQGNDGKDYHPGPGEQRGGAGGDGRDGGAPSEPAGPSPAE